VAGGLCLLHCNSRLRDPKEEWWGEAILTACHVLNRVPTKNNEITPFEEWFKKKVNLSYLRTRGCLTMVNVPISKKCKLGPKTVDCVFLGYAMNSVGYRFLIVKSEVSDMEVGTIFESRDATFFETNFSHEKIFLAHLVMTLLFLTSI
jgi:hypothetical protein